MEITYANSEKNSENMTSIIKLESEKISDEKLYELCKKYGAESLTWRNKFIGLLPEVYKRKLYEKKGFMSIFELAAKLAGLSNEQVRIALNLEKRFENTPILQNLLISGAISINKLARVASIATAENEAELAGKIQQLSVRAIEVLVRDEKNKNQNGLFEPDNEDESLHVQMNNKNVQVNGGLAFELSTEVISQLNELNEQGQDVNEILSALLKERREKIEEKKEALSEEVKITNSRYIPVKVRSIVREEFGQKCSIRTCKKPSKEIHHSQRFSLSHTHDPKFMAPLCKEHHQIAHSVDMKVQDCKKNFIENFDL